MLTAPPWLGHSSPPYPSLLGLPLAARRTRDEPLSRAQGGQWEGGCSAAKVADSAACNTQAVRSRKGKLKSSHYAITLFNDPRLMMGTGELRAARATAPYPATPLTLLHPLLCHTLPCYCTLLLPPHPLPCYSTPSPCSRSACQAATGTAARCDRRASQAPTSCATTAGTSRASSTGRAASARLRGSRADRWPPWSSTRRAAAAPR